MGVETGNWEQPSLVDNTISLPVALEERNVTNKGFTITFIVFLAICMPFLGYTLYHFDSGRLLGYDDCGNICGQKNYKYDNIECSGQDFTDKPYLKDGVCVRECGARQKAVLNKCFYSGRIDYNDYESMSDSNSDSDSDTPGSAKFINSLSSAKWKIVLSILLCFVISGLLLIVFRYAVAVFVWGCIATITIGLIAGTVFFWYLYATTKEDVHQKKSAYLKLACAFTFFAIVVILVFIYLRKKVRLVIMLFKETAKVMFDLPHMLLVPLVSTLVTLLLAVIAILLGVLFLFSGTLQEIRPETSSRYSESDPKYEYRPNIPIIIAMCLCLVLLIWTREVIEGSKFMTIAGSVCKWFFVRNKHQLQSPIWTSTKIVFRFHMGTIFFGGLIITIVKIVRLLISSMQKNKHVKAFCDCIMETIEAILKALTRNAYIITALYGTPFLESGKKAATLILDNALDFSALNFVGDFVLAMAKMVIVLLSVLLSYLLLMDDEVFIFTGVFVGILSFIIGNSIFTTFENMVDTLFICFCEDMSINDGNSNPYYMTTGLMEFMEASKKVIGEKESPVEV